MVVSCPPDDRRMLAYRTRHWRDQLTCATCGDRKPGMDATGWGARLTDGGSARELEVEFLCSTCVAIELEHD
jgi:hypothetical protein